MSTLRRTVSLRSRSLVLLAALLVGAPAPAALAQAPIQPPAAAQPPAATPEAVTPSAPLTGGTQASPAISAQPATAQPVAPHAAEAPVEAVEEHVDASVSAQLPHDLSPWGMFMAADIVVKAVMIGLAFASVVTWTVWLAKTLELLVVTRRLRRALRALLGSSTLDGARVAVSDAAGPAAAMVHSTDVELGRSGDLPAEGIKERVAISLARIEAAAGRRITRGTGLLATIGATAPFVGLFGTVWGIMNSFIGISKAQTTNLAVVAPGIAEALLATAIGLVAAIPAVVIYNHFTRQVSGYRALLGDSSAEMLRLLSRDLDRRDATRYAPPRSRAAAE